MKKFIVKLYEHRYLLSLVIALNFLLTPLHISISNLSPTLVVVVNYSLVIIVGSMIATKRKHKLITSVLGVLTLIAVWLEFSDTSSIVFKIYRLIASLALFSNFSRIIFIQMRNIKEINLNFILGPILGFVYLGIIGGILFEASYLMDHNTFDINGGFSGYIFYYFSFVTITTLGYGDITPQLPSSQSLTVVMNIIGQFYLIIIIGVFVGKYINAKS